VSDEERVDGIGEDKGSPQPAGTADSDDEDLLDDQADAAEDFLHDLLDILDMDGEAEADIEDDTILVDLDGPDLAVLIGRHGATLEALQELMRAAVAHATESRVRIVLDIGGYRERQQEILERRARTLADKVRKEGTPIRMDPMSSYERRLVHQALAERDDVSTGSEGEEPDRYVVIRPA
jgi:spoIIIJ-associated protein